jgi:hypothetical protein
VAGTPDREDREFARFLERYDIAPPLGADERVARKLKLITDIGRADSIRDFGGVWGVHGLYLLEGARALGASYAQMVDNIADAEFVEGMERLRRDLPITVEMRDTDFRRPSLYDALRPVGVSVLYDVLLHQDRAVEVIQNVTGKTERMVCVAQPVLKESVFRLPSGCVNLLFYPEELKDMIRCAGWSREPAVGWFETTWWTWGQTVSYLTSVFHGYGWEREHLEAYDLSPHWAYALMRFAPRATGKTPSFCPAVGRGVAPPEVPSAGAHQRPGAFADIAPDFWAFAEIEACARAGLLPVFPDGSYRPGYPVTRALLAMVLARALAGGDDHVPETPGPGSFRDVPADHWAFRYIEYAHASGIAEGYPDGEYRPYLNLDRGQMAVFIARALAKQTGETEALARDGDTAPFPDVPPDHPACRHIAYLKTRGVTQGYPDGLYHPEMLCTRDQMAVYMARAFGLVV